MRLFIGIVTHRRPEVLEFMIRYMHLDARPEARAATEITVFENDTEMRNLDGLRSIASDIRPIGYSLLPHDRPDTSVEARNADLGMARQAIVEEFMRCKQYTHCMILDDDMVVSLNTIYQAARDLQSFEDLGVASLTLHPFSKRFGPRRYQMGDSIFIDHDFSGDNAWIFPRSTIKRFGNKFGSEQGGYANVLWAAIQASGMANITRLHPCYEIQHIGVQSLVGSIIYEHSKKKPGWTTTLFQDYNTKRILHSEVAMLWSANGVGPLLDYVRKETRMHKHDRIDVGLVRREEASTDRMLMPKGRVEIQVENVRTGGVQSFKVDNLVVNNAKTIMAHLLGGETAADWAITRMLFGSGTTAPTESDVNLEIPLTPEKPVVVDYPDSSSVRFTGVLESSEANGFPISEAALYSASEGIFSRIVFGPLNKSADFRFVFRWTIYW